MDESVEMASWADPKDEVEKNRSDEDSEAKKKKKVTGRAPPQLAALFDEEQDTEEETVEEDRDARYGQQPSKDEVSDDDSESFPAVWVSPSEEAELLRKRDYNSALQEAKRLNALNDVRLGRKVKYAQQQSEPRDPEEEVDEEVDTNEDNEEQTEVKDGVSTTRAKSAMMQSRIQTFESVHKEKSWNPFRGAWATPSKSNGRSKVQSVKQEEAKNPQKSSMEFKSLDTTAESKEATANKSRGGPIDLDEVGTNSDSQDETREPNDPDVRKIQDVPSSDSKSKSSKAVSSVRSGNAKSQNRSTRSVSSWSRRSNNNNRIFASDSNKSKLSQVVEGMESKVESLKSKSQDKSSPTTPGIDGPKKQDPEEMKSDSILHVLKEGEEDGSSPDVKDFIPVRNSGSQSAERTDTDTYNSDGDSYMSSVRPVTNDEIIKAVRGEKNVVGEQPGVGKNLDGLASWFISGFDSLANVGLKDPIGFLDWSGEEREIRKLQTASGHGASDRFKHVKDEQGVLTLRKTAAAAASGGPRRKSQKSTSGQSVSIDEDNRNGSRASSSQISSSQEETEEHRGVRDPQRLHLQTDPPTIPDSLMMHPRVQREQQKLGANQASPKGKTEVKSLHLETQGNEPQKPVQNSDEQNENKEQIPPETSRKIPRDLVSISSIQIPTPEKTIEDEYSVSILGLARNKRSLQSSASRTSHKVDSVKKSEASQQVNRDSAKQQKSKKQNQQKKQEVSPPRKDKRKETSASTKKSHDKKPSRKSKAPSKKPSSSKSAGQTRKPFTLWRK
jgi:hypothetical protein